MTETHVISALTTKRAELSGELIEAEKRVIQLRADLDSLDRAIRIFDPDLAPKTIRPIVRRKPTPLLPKGEGSKAVLNLLRRADEPLTAREIAERLVSDYRLEIGTGQAMNKFIGKVRNTLARQKPGVLVSRQRGDAIEWRAAD
jgi:hypothetical protein